MLQWRGGGRTIAHEPAALRDIGYIFEERAALHEHHGGLDRDRAERLAWQHVAREWRGILSSAPRAAGGRRSSGGRRRRVAMPHEMPGFGPKLRQRP